MERRRNLLDNYNHFKGKTNIRPLNFKFNLINHSVMNNETSGYFDFTYDFDLTSLFMCFSGSAMSNCEIIELNTPNVTNMVGMFYHCEQLTSLILNKNSFDANQVTNMTHMFAYCSRLISLDLSTFSTNKLNSMKGMFKECTKLQSLNISTFNTSKVITLEETFANCSSLTSLDLSNFNTSNVTNMANMFSGCSGLTSLDLSNFDASNIMDETYVTNMFENCNNLDSIATNVRFQQWCIDNAETIKLPLKFRNSIYRGWYLIADVIPKD